MASTCGGGRGRSPLSPLGLLVCFFGVASSAQLQPPLEVRSFRYASFESSNSGELMLLKDASVNGGALQLTPDTRNNHSLLVNKSGSVLLCDPFVLWSLDEDLAPAPAAGSNGTNGNSTAGQTQRPVRVMSFNSTFSMNVFYDTARPGEGLTFLIAPSLDGPPPGSHGGFLGLTNATLDATPAKNRFVAIEFDTVSQTYDPPNGNHVGLDIGSVVSNKTANLADFNITSIATTEANAANYTVWVEYDGVARHISVFMGLRGKPKPASPVLDSPLDLSEHVPEKSYLGFSASTGTDFELNCILDWSLSIETIPEKTSKTWIIVVAVFVTVSVIVIAVAAFFLTKRSKKLRARRSMERRQEQLEITVSNLPGMPRKFTYEMLNKATQNFDEGQRSGKGGFGEVYKGMLPADDASPEEKEVAVKKFTRDDAKNVYDFLAELEIINRLRHKNIVPLTGWCYEKGQHLLLVYEYMPNGSLDQHLFPRDVHGQVPVLSWKRRYDIVADVAAGLHYMHNEYTPMVLHRDIKASNVLLEATFGARLGDFGLARVIGQDKNWYTDIDFAGTYGYIAPEYAVSRKATRQSDVFAFGALVMEVVTGRRALLRNPGCLLLSDWMWQMHGSGALLDTVDKNLRTTGFDAEEATRLLLLALACCNPNPEERPTMPLVLQVLSKAKPPPDVPAVKPKFDWPPEGETHFNLSDIEMTTRGEGTANGTSSAMATEGTSFGTLQYRTAPSSTDEYFTAVSARRGLQIVTTKLSFRTRSSDMGVARLDPLLEH